MLIIDLCGQGRKENLRKLNVKMSKSQEISASELVLSAIFFLQQKNGVTAAEITKFICEKRKCKPTEVKSQVRKALDRAIKNGIFSRKRGLYRIENGFGEKVNALRRKGRQQANRRKKGKPKNPKNGLLKKTGLRDNDYEEEMNSLKNKIYQAGASAENGFPFHRLEVFENKAEGTADDDRSNSSDSREDHISLNGVKRGVALDNEEYEDEDFSEDDEDDDIDYFADEQHSVTKRNISASGSRRKSPATEKNDSSDSEAHDRRENNRRKVTKVIDTSVKHTRKRASDGSKNEENKNDYEENRRDRPRIDGRKGNKALQNNRRRFEDDESENNNSGESDEEKRDSADKKESDFSNEDSDSDNVSIMGNENDQESSRSSEKNGNAQNECQKQEEGKTKELQQNLQEDFQQQKKDMQLEKQNTLQNDVTNSSKDDPDPDPNLDLKKTNECGKQTLSEPHLGHSKTPPVQENIPPTDGYDSRFAHLRSAQKRIACRESKSSKRSRCK